MIHSEIKKEEEEQEESKMESGGVLSATDQQNMVSLFLEIAVGQTADTARQFLQVPIAIPVWLILIDRLIMLHTYVYLFMISLLELLLTLYFFGSDSMNSGHKLET